MANAEVETATLVMHLIAIVFGLYLAYLMYRLTRKKGAASMAKTFRILGLSFLLLAAIAATRFFSFLPDFPWSLIEAIAQVLFLLIIYYVITKLNSTMQAYEFLASRERRARGLE